jgi:hypothetical protein
MKKRAILIVQRAILIVQRAILIVVRSTDPEARLMGVVVAILSSDCDSTRFTRARRTPRHAP